MEQANVKEYELVRQETEFIRGCITTYMGYAISGSGAALFGLAALKFSEGEVRIPSALIALTLALILSLVLAILIYKFNSHNRYVGYARVITDEMYDPACTGVPTHDGAHTAWEICMERLRVVHNVASDFITLCDATTIAWKDTINSKLGINWMIDAYVGRGAEPAYDQRRTIRGIKQLWLALIGRSKTNSWAFPPYVVAVFFVLVSIYLVIGVYCVAILTYEDVYSNSVGVLGHKLRLLQFYSAFMLVVLLFLWRAFCRKLCLLMNGSLTVDSYSFRFTIVRASVLNGRGIFPSYPSFELLMNMESKHLHAIQYEPVSHEA